jgi:transposase InsO family protein
MGEVRVIKTADFRKEEKCTLKKERIYRKEYGTIWDVKKDMFRYIELFYNRKRLHSVLKYMSPVAYRLKYDATKVA